MRILLTTSAAPLFSPFSTKEKRFPLGLGFLISVLREKGHKVFFIDNYLSPTHFYEGDFVVRNRIDIVGIYASTICFDDTLRMIKSLHRLRKTGKWNGLIVVGGPHTTVNPESIPDEVDFIVQGEGEKAILQIVDGTTTERIIRADRIKNLDDVPSPAWDYFVKLPYDYTVEWFDDAPVFTMNTSRGCPFKCSFCSVGSIWGKKYTFMSAERIVSDIEFLIKQYNIKGVYFREDNFTLRKDRVRSFCELLLKKGLQIKWICETRVDTLDEELLRLMYRAGCRGVYLGIESGSQRVLDFLKKGITIQQATEIVNLCKKIGIHTAASFIIGVPTETEKEQQETIRFARKLRSDIKWINVFVGIPDSELYKYVLKNKLYEFRDSKGFVYLKGNNVLAEKVYGKSFIYIHTDQEAISAEHQLEIIKDSTIKNPRISVIMSVYNGARFLKKSVESILQQEFDDFELIIVDDGSTDSSIELLLSLQDDRIKIVKQNHLGLTIALNNALRMAKGEFIARMDADDISTKDRLLKEYDFLKKNNSYGMVGTAFWVIDEKDKIIGKFPVFTDDRVLKRMMLVDNQFCHGSLMFRREVVERVGVYDTFYKYAQDYEYIWRISKVFKIGAIPEYLYKWRKVKTSISLSRSKEQQLYANELKEKMRNEYLNEYRFQKIFSPQKSSPFKGLNSSIRLKYRYSINCAKLGWYYLRNGIDDLAEELFKDSINTVMPLPTVFNKTVGETIHWGTVLIGRVRDTLKKIL